MFNIKKIWISGKQIVGKLSNSANKKSAYQIKTIARAQKEKRKAEALGIKKGIFRTSEDEGVRKSHAELNGVEYDLSKGAWSKTAKKFIQPGITDINCRCNFSSVIEL